MFTILEVIIPSLLYVGLLFVCRSRLQLLFRRRPAMLFPMMGVFVGASIVYAVMITTLFFKIYRNLNHHPYPSWDINLAFLPIVDGILAAIFSVAFVLRVFIQSRRS